MVKKIGLGAFVGLIGLIAGLFWPAAAFAETERPNIVWVVSEDNSASYLRLYDEGGAPMPAVERLAEQGIVFNHAFSNSPVCSTARSSIISGCYGPRVFSQYHRRSELAPMPEGLRMFPWYLRQAGYYTTNNSKEDYNFVKEDGVWDASSGKASYRDRAAGQPFFHVQNFGTTHEGKLHFGPDKMPPTATDPKTVAVSPIHPDTELFRYTNARYRDLHRDVDEEIGAFLKELEADGLKDDTIIFYYGDHGGVLPGSKGYINERGLQVPMVVYAPEKWRHLLPSAPGTRVDGFVSFVDLAPTALNLAGIQIPDRIDGKAFLGQGVSLKELNRRDTNFSYADRFDEKYDMVRALRKGNFKYIRSYQPFNPPGLFNDYRYKMQAYREWRDLYWAGKLNAAQSEFFEARPAETLYDLSSDPEELNNLAADPKYKRELAQLRSELTRRVKGMPDLGFFPEPYLLEAALSNPTAFGQSDKGRIGALIATADLSLKPYRQVEGKIAKALKSSDPWMRYWALIVCSSFGKEAAGFAKSAKEISDTDEENLVRLRAVEFLGLIGEQDPKAGLIGCLKRSDTEVEATLVLNTFTLFRDLRTWPAFAVEDSWVNPEWLKDGRGNVSRRYEYLKDL